MASSKSKPKTKMKTIKCPCEESTMEANFTHFEGSKTAYRKRKAFLKDLLCDRCKDCAPSKREEARERIVARCACFALAEHISDEKQSRKRLADELTAKCKVCKTEKPDDVKKALKNLA